MVSKEEIREKTQKKKMRKKAEIWKNIMVEYEENREEYKGKEDGSNRKRKKYENIDIYSM